MVFTRTKADPAGFPQRKVSQVPAVSVDQMREIQRLAQEEFAYDILQINENAGRATAEIALAMLGGRGRGQRVVILAGPGNTGASGLCAARHLSNWGFDVEPIFGTVEEEMSFATRRQLQVLEAAGLVRQLSANGSSEVTLEEHLNHGDLIIDALAGYGLMGPPTGMIAAITEMASVSRTSILAIENPTGVDAGTGDVCSPSIRARTTVTFDLPKKGLLQPAAREALGDLYLADIGIPRAAHERLGIAVKDLYSEGPILRLRF